jgi:predicted RNase H-like nuclease (RuvC/YqgF family)
MTEKEFDQQVWRRFDTVTLDTGMETTIMNVCFSTRSIRIYVKSAPPEWVSFERITKHKSRFGSTDEDADDIIEKLHSTVLGHQERIDKLEAERKELREQLSKNYAGALLTQINIVGSQLQEKRKRIDRIEASLLSIEEIIENNKLQVNP